MTRSSLSAALLAAVLATPGATQERPRPEQLFRRFDRNGDGVLVKDELPPALANAFGRADANKDGKIDSKEFEALVRALPRRPGGQPGPGAGALVERMLQRLDANRDGKIEKKEAQGPLAELFDRADANRDGFLDRAELTRVAGRFGGPGGAPGPGRRDADFDDLDLNADGRLTREEVRRTPLAEQSDRADANKDGKIDPKEFAAHQGKRPADR